MEVEIRVVTISRDEYLGLKAIQHAVEALFRAKDQGEWDAAEQRLRELSAEARRQ